MRLYSLKKGRFTARFLSLRILNFRFLEQTDNFYNTQTQIMITTKLSRSFIIACTTLAFSNTHAQSTSVFDATFFNKDNAEPPIKPGKGFHINDVYKQTKYCFTNETCRQDKLVRSQEGTKTTIKLFYTRNEEEYNSLKTQGASGKVSFLNLFSFDGSKLQEFTTKTDKSVEKLVFVAKVDFGVYSYDNDPVLAPEASDMIVQGRHDEFIQLYGTHYISGVRRENSIWIILTKEQSASDQSSTDNNAINMKAPIPSGGTANFELKDGTLTENLINNYKYSVSVEINGPSMKQADIQKKISKVLSDESKNKLEDIKDILTKAAEELADQNKSLISQYYYAPFDLYNLKGIYWDEKKQNSLTKINEAVLQVYNVKIDLDELLNPSTKAEFADTYLKEVPEFSTKALYKKKLEIKYTEVLPILKNYQATANLRLTQLEENYKTCSDIKCNQATNCCNNLMSLTDVSQISNPSKKEITKLEAIRQMTFEAYIKELTTPECESKQQGIITITNRSANPYELFQGDKYIETIEGGGQKQYLVNPGEYKFKAQQKSGYLMYPTINYRKATVQKTCEEFALLIGFED